MTQANLTYTFPILIVTSYTAVIYWRITAHFHNIFNIEATRNDLREAARYVFSPEETLQLLNRIGLDFLTYDGSFCTMIFYYLLQLGNLMNIIDLDLAEMDEGVLRFMLGRLLYLITHHELIFNVFSNFVRMSEHLDIGLNYDPELLKVEIRTAGNRLHALYRLIEFELNIEV